MSLGINHVLVAELLICCLFSEVTDSSSLSLSYFLLFSPSACVLYHEHKVARVMDVVMRFQPAPVEHAPPALSHLSHT